jgi:hypothetical protein
MTNTTYEIVTLKCKMGMSGQIHARTNVSAGKELPALLEQVNECISSLYGPLGENKNIFPLSEL